MPNVSFVSIHSIYDTHMHRSLHVHDSICELTLITDGKGEYIYNHEKYKIQTGDVVIANAGDLHELISDTEQEIGHYVIGMKNLKMIGKNLNQIIKTGDACVIHLADEYSMVKNLIEQLYALSSSDKERNEYPKQLISAAILYMACSKTKSDEKEKESLNCDFFFRRVNRYIDEHLTEDFRLQDIAAFLSCSDSYLRHRYKEQTGASIRKYIIKRRIGLAQTLLISTDLPIKDVATYAGYNNVDYFSTSFAKEVGRTPSGYRENYFQGYKGDKNQT